MLILLFSFGTTLIFYQNSVFMSKNDNSKNAQRREFLGALATGAASLGIASLLAPLNMEASPLFKSNSNEDPDAWFNKIKGKHRVVFDATEPKEILTFAWPRVFLLTNSATGTQEKDCSVVVVLRHNTIPYVLNDDMWAKYKLGEMFKINTPGTTTPATKHPYWKPAPGTFKVPGIGPVNIGLNELQDSGVMFCGCNVALTVYSAVVAGSGDPAAVYKEWTANLLPGIQLVPSGVWGVGRAQEHGCAYIAAG